MADNIVLNPGTGGDTVAAKDIGGIKHPIQFALAQPKTIKVDVTRPADTAAYAVADAISNSTSAPTSGGFTITGAARQSGGSCLITDVCVASSNDPATRLSGEIMIFDQAVTNINDNVAYGVSDAEIKTKIATIPFSLFDAGNWVVYPLYLCWLCRPSLPPSYPQRIHSSQRRGSELYVQSPPIGLVM
jgi:hypothetical protein